MQSEKFKHWTFRLKVDYTQLMESVIQGLKHEGFVVVTEIDLQEKLNGIERRYTSFKVMWVYTLR
jgi:uncharacterized protein (DUF302 family)